MKVARQGCWLRSCRSSRTGNWDPLTVACLPPSGGWGTPATAGACYSAAAHNSSSQRHTADMQLLHTCLQIVTAPTHVPAGYDSFYTHACHYASFSYACRSLHTCMHVVTAVTHIPADRYGSYTHACRSLRPAQDAASVLQRYKQENPTSKLGMQDAHPERQAHADDSKQQQGICRNCFPSHVDEGQIQEELDMPACAGF